MNKQAPDRETTQDLACLLQDILADLESALTTARNKPAKRLLQERIDRLSRAIDALAATEPQSRSTADTDVERLFGT
jgi:hypothetical protein